MLDPLFHNYTTSLLNSHLDHSIQSCLVIFNTRESFLFASVGIVLYSKVCHLFLHSQVLSFYKVIVVFFVIYKMLCCFSPKEFLVYKRTRSTCLKQNLEWTDLSCVEIWTESWLYINFWILSSCIIRRQSIPENCIQLCLSIPVQDRNQFFLVQGVSGIVVLL